MNYFLRIVGIVLLFGSLGACANKDNTLPPTALQPLPASKLSLQPSWQTQVGKTETNPGASLVPAISGAEIYTADGAGNLIATTLKKGEPLWQVSLNTPILAGVGAHPEAPIITVSNQKGELIALDKTDGKEKWRQNLSSISLAPAALSKAQVAVLTRDSELMVLSVDDGAVIWRHTEETPALTIYGTSQPVIVGDRIFAAFANGQIKAFDRVTGQLLWQQALAIPEGWSDIQRLVDITADMVIVGNQLYAVSYQGRIAAIRLEDGTIAWARKMSSFAGLAVQAPYVFVTDADDRIWALDLKNGQSYWQQPALLHRGLTKGAVIGGQLVLADKAGYVHVLRRVDGDLIARWHLRDEAILVAPIAQGDTLVVLGEKGTLTRLAFSVKT